MKCLMFFADDPSGLAAGFNVWGKGKELSSDVIIRTHSAADDKATIRDIVIIVIYDEKKHPDWEIKE